MQYLDIYLKSKIFLYKRKTSYNILTYLKFCNIVVFDHNLELLEGRQEEKSTADNSWGL